MTMGAGVPGAADFGMAMLSTKVMVVRATAPSASAVPTTHLMVSTVPL